MLLTARSRDVFKVAEDCTCQMYPVKPLALESALQVLCRRIDREKETKSIMEERPLVIIIAEKFSSCPLILEVVGAYLGKCKHKHEAYEMVLNWHGCEEIFSAHQECGFNE